METRSESRSAILTVKKSNEMEEDDFKMILNIAASDYFDVFY